MTIERIARFAGICAAAFCVACSPAPAERTAASTPGASPIEMSELVGQMRDMAWAKDVDAARDILEQQRQYQDTGSAPWLVAASWLGRGASFAERWDVAERYAREAYDGSRVLLEERELDADGELQTALGAGIEVLGRVFDARGDRAGAVEFLRTERARYAGTSIETRIQKNVLLLSLEGQPFPVLDVDYHLGAPLPSADSLKGHVVVAFFWAHWCPDCKRQLPILEQLHAKYAERGLLILGPTQLYGYVSRGTAATPEEELAYLRGDYQKQYPVPSWMSVPVSQQNFLEFGVSTTPTVVVIDRKGIVQLYNPGTLSYEELALQIERLLET